MINKQKIWFLTLFSLILVLSVYYITMPSELLTTAKTTDTTKKETTKKDTTEVNETDVLTALQVERDEEQVNETSKEAFKKPYDVEEISKIAKSPIVAVPEVKETIEKDDYVNVEPIINEKETDTMEAEYSERDIVEEMIRRLTKRLEEIDERRESYKEEKTKLEEDEAFVNDLIESSNAKREDLDKFEQELNDKEEELNNKQKELEKKINDVMPFANAVLNSEKES